MQQAAGDAVQFIHGKDRATWAEDKLLRLAVERCIEILGEAARRVSETTCRQHPEVPWRRVVGMRNVLAHEYGQIDHARIFDTVETDLPRLVQAVAAILPKDEPE